MFVVCLFFLKKAGNLDLVNFLLQKGAKIRDFQWIFPLACSVCIFWIYFRFRFRFCSCFVKNTKWNIPTGRQCGHCQVVSWDGRRSNWFIQRFLQSSSLPGFSRMSYYVYFAIGICYFVNFVRVLFRMVIWKSSSF